MLRAALLASLLTVAACAPGPVVPRASLLVDRGRTEEAVALLREHLAREPGDVEARRMLTRVLGFGGDLAAAAREAELLAARLGPGDPTPWLELGAAYELSHRFEEALALYDRAALEAPSDPRGPRTAGLRAARWGEAELAEPRLREALRRDPRHGGTWHALGLVLLSRGDVAAARDAYRRGLQADPGALENRLGLATVALLAGDHAAALEQYDAIARARPRFADAELGRAYALTRLGRLQEARRALDAAARAGADPVAVARQRSDLAARSGHR